MKSIAGAMLAAALGPQFVLADDGGSFRTTGARVADSAAAVRIAEKFLVAAHGEFLVELQRPYFAYVKDDVWIVKGTFGSLRAKFALTHRYVVEISGSDARVLRAGTE